MAASAWWCLAVIAFVARALVLPAAVRGGVRRVGSRLESAVDSAEGVRRGLGSVCCIFSTCVEPDYMQPWSQYPEEDASGSGFFVEDAGGRLKILTNEHVVRHARDVRVRPHGSPERYKCSVVYASAERDLALLVVEDEAFYSAHAPAPLALGEALPELYETVAVLGYPMGGDNVCVTRGVVSRVDTIAYGDGRGERLLAIQIDAAINSGNSGGPAVEAGGAVVGVAFSGFAGDADNIGYIIPALVAHNFLQDAGSHGAVAGGRCPGLCSLGVSAQATTSAALRRRLRMGDLTGVLVTRVAPGSAASDAVRAGDVLLAVDGAPVANDGTIVLRASERVDASHATTRKRDGDAATVAVLRDGRRVESDVRLAPVRRLVPLSPKAFDDVPTYAILGGLVLMPLTASLVDAVRRETELQVDIGFDGASYGDRPEGDDAEIVVWASTLTSDANYGYADLCAKLPRLATVNGDAPRNLRHALDLCRSCRRQGHDFYDLRFVEPNGGAAAPVAVVLDIDDVDDGDFDLLEKNNIPDLCSPDLIDAYYDAPAPLPRRAKPKKGRRTKRGR